MAPYPDPRPGFEPGWEGGPAVIPGAILAAEHVNCRQDVLNDFELKILYADSGCQVLEKTVNNYTRFLFHSKEKDHIVGIIGTGCSGTTGLLGRLLVRPKLSLLNISPGATSPILTDNSTYPNTFRPIASALGFVNTLIDLIREQNYTIIGALYESERSFQRTVYTRFESRVKSLETKPILVSFGVSTGFIGTPLEGLENRARVIFVIAGQAVARSILCLAYHKNMLFPDYQWIFIERGLSTFTTKSVSVTFRDTVFSCTPEVMKLTTNGIILHVSRLTRNNTNITTDTGYSYDEFSTQYDTEVQKHLADLPGINTTISTPYHNVYYDATWAFALSLNNSIPHLNASLSTYKSGQPEVTEIIRSQLLSLQFEGMVGTIRFSEETLDGEESTVIDILQVVVVNNEPTAGFAGWYRKSDGLSLRSNVTLIEETFETTVITIPLVLGAVVLTVIGCLTISTVIFQLVNALNPNYKFLKATSPHFNHIIFSGCYLYLVAAVLYTGQQTFAGSFIERPVVYGLQCSSFIWCVCMGYSLILSTICAKTWRIHRIFTHFKSQRVTLVSDYLLMSIILTFLSLDIVLISVWNLKNPWRVESDTASNSDGRVFIIAYCHCDNQLFWVIGVSSYKILLTVIVLYLSIATRKVNKKEFKQTKTINFLVYTLVLIYGVLIPIYVVLFQIPGYGSFIVSFCSLCFVLIGSVIACTLFIFLPPVLPFFYKHADKRFIRRASSLLLSSRQNSFSS